MLCISWCSDGGHQRTWLARSAKQVFFGFSHFRHFSSFLASVLDAVEVLGLPKPASPPGSKKSQTVLAALWLCFSASEFQQFSAISAFSAFVIRSLEAVKAFGMEKPGSPAGSKKVQTSLRRFDI